MNAAALALPITRLRAWTRNFFEAHVVAAEPELAAPPPSIETRRVDPKRIGKGFVDVRQAGKARIVVTVEASVLEQVHARAVARGVPVAVIIREFVDRGLAEDRWQ